MKNLILVGALLTALSAVSFAGHKNSDADVKMRHDYYAMQKEMIDDEMQYLERRMKRLTNYQRHLLNMMNNEGSTHAG